MNINVSSIHRASLTYILLPILIFLGGWLKWYIATPLIILCVASYLIIIKRKNAQSLDINTDKQLHIKPVTLIIILFILGVWVMTSGIGGFMWQNKDHLWRNAIFTTLIDYNWPVYGKDYSLCYYIGFWLPAAIVGKLCHSLFAANIFLFLWTWAGLIIFYLQICLYLQKTGIKILLLIIFFSGIDIIGYSTNIIKHHSITDYFNLLKDFPHIEWSHGSFQASSITTQLFWVFNQALPFWIGMMLLISKNNMKNMLFIFACLMLYSPFPAVGILPVLIYLKLNEWKESGLKQGLQSLLGVENLTAILVLAVISTYFTSNIASGKSTFMPPSARYLFFILTQYLVYIIFILKENYKDPVLIILFITALIFPLYRMGDGADFRMRTNIPFIIYTMLLFIRFLLYSKATKSLRILAILVFVTGSITPAFEIMRSVRNAILCHQTHTSVMQSLTSHDSIFDDGLIGINFIGNKESFFFKYLAK